MAGSYRPNASEIALLVVLLIQRYQKDRGKEVSRIRLARSSLRRLAIRARLEDKVINDWIDTMSLEYGWLVYVDFEEFFLIKKDSAATWTKIATKRCDDIIKKLKKGERESLDDAEEELEETREIHEDNDEE